MNARTVFASLFLLLALLTLNATRPLAEDFRMKVEPQAYVRTNVQTGSELGERGQSLTTGFMRGNRLQEGQYFELGFRVLMHPQARLYTLFAHGGDTFHYDGGWGEQIALRNLFLEIDNKSNSPDYTLWFGSRIYRGDDINIFDMWPLDDQNILGGGVQIAELGDSGISPEFAFGVKKDIGLEAPLTTSITGGGDGISTQRFIAIVKLKKSFAPFYLKTNFEYQFIPNEASLSFDDGSSAVSPKTWGIMAGAQITYAEGDFWGRVLYNYAFGDVVGGVYTSRYTDEDVLVDAGTGIVRTRRDSQIHRIGSTGAYSQSRWSVMYGALLDWYVNAYAETHGGVSVAVRPMFYLTKHFHLGGEVDFVGYLKKRDEANFSAGDVAGDINYGQFAVIFRYALDKSILGVPKFRLIYSHAVYAEEREIYGTLRRHAFNISAGFELWI